MYAINSTLNAPATKEMTRLRPLSPISTQDLCLLVIMMRCYSMPPMLLLQVMPFLLILCLHPNFRHALSMIMPQQHPSKSLVLSTVQCNTMQLHTNENGGIKAKNEWVH